MNYKWIPNILTSSRFFLVPVFLFFLFSDFSHGKLLALIIFILAALTDAYDGKIARKYNHVSKFGIFFDPLADKFLVLSAFYAFMFFPVLSTTIKIWMIILISFRDIFITILRMIMQYKGITMVTSKLGKLKTFLQFSTIFLILLYLIFHSYNNIIPIKYLHYKALYFLMVITTITTFYTGAHYLIFNYKTLESLLSKK